MYIDKLAELKVGFAVETDFCSPLIAWLFSLWLSVHDAVSSQKLGQPIQERFTEAEERPKAFEDMGKQIQQYMKFVEAYKMKVKPES